MPISRRIIAGSLAMVAGATVVVAAVPAAQAADVETMKVSCSAVNIRLGPSQHSTILGVAYRGDTMRVNQFAYKASEGRWYSRGTVTRKSDGVKKTGYGTYDCINPYGASPPPAYPKRP